MPANAKLIIYKDGDIQGTPTEIEVPAELLTVLADNEPSQIEIENKTSKQRFTLDQTT